MNPQPKTNKRTRQEYHQFSRGQAEFGREEKKKSHCHKESQ